MKATVLLFFQNKAAGTRYAVTSPVQGIGQDGLFVNIYFCVLSIILKKSRNI